MGNEPQNTMPEGWRPEEGETIEGIVRELGRNWSDYQNNFYPILTLEVNGELTNVHAFHATLKNALMDKQPHVGDRVIITYHGKRDTRDGKRTVALYSLDTPDREQDAGAFWQTLASTWPPAVTAQPPVTTDDQEPLPF